MSVRPQVSICIPTRNRARFLHDALAHLTEFTLFDFEVVVSDNCSDDDTAQVVESFRDRLPSLYYIRQETPLSCFQTVQPPFNVAAGDYLVYLADDDHLVEEGIDAVVRSLDADPTIACAYGAWQEIRDGELATKHQEVPAPVRLSFTDLAEICTSFADLEMPIIRRTAYESALTPIQYQYAFDLAGLAQLLKAGDMLIVPTLTHLVTRHVEQSSTQLYREEILQNYLADYEGLTASCPELRPATAMVVIARKISGKYLDAAQRAITDKRFLQARSLVHRALAYHDEKAEAWRCYMDRELWPHMIAESAIAFARTAQPVNCIVVEQTPAMLPKAGNREREQHEDVHTKTGSPGFERRHRIQGGLERKGEEPPWICRHRNLAAEERRSEIGIMGGVPNRRIIDPE